MSEPISVSTEVALCACLNALGGGKPLTVRAAVLARLLKEGRFWSEVEACPACAALELQAWATDRPAPEVTSLHAPVFGGRAVA